MSPSSLRHLLAVPAVPAVADAASGSERAVGRDMSRPQPCASLGRPRRAADFGSARVARTHCTRNALPLVSFAAPDFST
jgi:hypothetical protein